MSASQLATYRARGGSSAVILGVILLILIVGGAGGYYLYTHTPQYAAAQMMKAIAAKDSTGFDRWVNVDLVSTQVIQSAQARLDDLVPNAGEGATFGGGGLLRDLAKAAMAKNAPKLQERIKSEMLKRVSEGNFSWDLVADFESKPLKNLAAEVMSGTSSTFGSIGAVKSSGDTAMVTLNYTTANGPRTVTLDMKKGGEAYEVVGVEGERS